MNVVKKRHFFSSYMECSRQFCFSAGIIQAGGRKQEGSSIAITCHLPNQDQEVDL